MTSLQSWNDQFGEIKLFAEKSSGFEPELEVAYPVRITGAKVVKSSRGDVQLDLAVEFQSSESENADVLGKKREWVTLPRQESDCKLDKTVVEKITQRRFGDLKRILSAAAPEYYAPYHEMKVVNGKKTYFDFDGEALDNEKYSAREESINTRIVQWTESLNEGDNVEILDDALLYIAKAPNAKNPKYPYTNWYAKRPQKMRVYESVSDSAPF